jgi:hypothetical protein
MPGGCVVYRTLDVVGDNRRAMAQLWLKPIPPWASAACGSVCDIQGCWKSNFRVLRVSAPDNELHVMFPMGGAHVCHASVSISPFWIAYLINSALRWRFNFSMM